jgi:hypothetical protein
VDVSAGGAAWNVAAFRRGGDARSIPRIRIPGKPTRDRNVPVFGEARKDTYGKALKRSSKSTGTDIGKKWNGKDCFVNGVSLHTQTRWRQPQSSR